MSNQVVKPRCDLSQGTMFDRLDEFSKNVPASLDHGGQIIQCLFRLAAIPTLESSQAIGLLLLLVARRAYDLDGG